jgi:hypothetical protein
MGETMHVRFASTLVLCLLGAVAPALTLDSSSLDFSTPREKSMGGIHVALADDSSVLLSNPAGLADAPSQLSAADLAIQTSGPIFDIANLIVNGSLSTSSLTNFLAANNYRLYTGLELSGPLAFGYTGNGLGFGVYNKTQCDLKVASASSIGINADEDILLDGGYALSFDLGKGNELAAGVGAKGYVLGDITTPSTMGIVEAVDYIDNPGSLFSQNFSLTTGIGVDLGVRWSWKDQVAAGLVYRNAFSPAIQTTYSSLSSFLSNASGSHSAEYGTIPSSLDCGVMWKPNLGRVGEVIDSFVIALDYKDILDLFNILPRNPILNVGFGVEARVLSIVSLRAGVADALPAAGIGLDLHAFTLNLAAYGTELGLDPGDWTCYNLVLDFNFRY